MATGSCPGDAPEAWLVGPLGVARTLGPVQLHAETL